MTNIMDELNAMMGKDDKFGYHCTKCAYSMEVISFNDLLHNMRKLFYCTRKDCERFGIITVVAIKKAKS